MEYKEENNKFYGFIYKALIILCMLFFAFVFVSSFIYTVNVYKSPAIVALKLFAIFLFIMLAFYLISRRLNERQFLILLILTAFILRVIWILKVNTQPNSDFLKMYQSAVMAAKGDFSFGRDAYFVKWVYQLGFTMYEALVIKIFGPGIFMLKLLNVLFSVGIVVLVYRTASKIFNETAGRIAGLVYALYIPSIVMCSVLTNDILSTLLFYSGFYFLITRGLKDRHAWIYTGVLLSLGDVIRPVGPLVLLAVIIYFVIAFIIGNAEESKTSLTKKFVGVLIAFYFTHYLVSYLFIGMGVTQYTLSDRDPLWKFVLGLNQQTTGQWSGSDSAYLIQFPLGPERRAHQIKLIEERIQDKKKLAELFFNKSLLLWSNPDAATFWSTWNLKQYQTERLLNEYERLSYINIVFFAIIALIGLIRSKGHKGSMLFILLILGYAAVHLFIEIQTRYRFFIIPDFAIIEGYGVYLVYNFIGTFLKGSRKGIFKGRNEGYSTPH